jgi:hypothetical protein
MTHGTTGNRPVIDHLTQKRLAKIQATEKFGVRTIENFGIFIDTHRDQPHVGVFFDDIHRGQCRPMLVHYDITDDYLIDAESGTTLPRHDKHMFVTPEFYAQFLTDYMMQNGTDPRDGAGCLPTSHFRDARAKVYELKSFREMVRLRAIKENIRI